MQMVRFPWSNDRPSKSAVIISDLQLGASLFVDVCSTHDCRIAVQSCHEKFAITMRVGFSRECKRPGN